MEPQAQPLDQPVGSIETNSDAKTWGMLAHLTALSGWIGVPFGSIIGPLIMWQIKKNEHPFVDYHGKEALNFNLSVLIYAIVGAVLSLVFIGIFVLIALVIFHIVVTIIAAIKANNGEYYQYPLTIRMIK